jgi:hypothetical protein
VQVQVSLDNPKVSPPNGLWPNEQSRANLPSCVKRPILPSRGKHLTCLYGDSTPRHRTPIRDLRLVFLGQVRVSVRLLERAICSARSGIETFQRLGRGGIRCRRLERVRLERLRDRRQRGLASRLVLAETGRRI